MSYVERMKALIQKRGGKTDGLKTVSDCIKALEALEEKPKYQPSPVPKNGPVEPE